jgi:hypothetical protein
MHMHMHMHIFHRGLMATMIADLSASFRYEGSADSALGALVEFAAVERFRTTSSGAASRAGKRWGWRAGPEIALM